MDIETNDQNTKLIDWYKLLCFAYFFQKRANILIFHQILLALCILLLGVSGGPAAALPGETVRVAILKGQDEIKIEGEGLVALDDRGNSFKTPGAITLRRGRDNSVVIGNRVVGRVTISSPYMIRINSKRYRGQMDISPYDRGLIAINELPLEDYLIGLINCEISSLWPIDAVKAQAVVARSYAIFQKDNRRDALFHLESTVLDQVYDGADIEDSRATRAVRETEGEVLTYAGSIIQSFYHANCGGHTEAAVNVWGADLPYLTGVDCKYCRNTPSARWEQTIPLKKIESSLRGFGYNCSGLTEIRLGKLNRSGRIQDILLVSAKGDILLSAVSFRKALGYTLIKSTSFSLRMRGDEAIISGTGNGHGVGLCQWGTKQRAMDGFNYREILSYYYPGVRLEKLKN